MSLRVHLLFNLPQYPITGISIFLIFVGVCSIAATVFGFIEVIWGSYIATGAWGGGMAIITGLYGAGAAYSKGVCSVTSFTVVAYFCCLVSIGQGVMSAAGLEFRSGFYPNVNLYTGINEGHTKIIHAILVGTAGLQFILALILAMICTRHICIGRKKEKVNQNTVLYGSSPFQRGKERASSSSQAPLVSGSNRKKPKKKKVKRKAKDHNTPSSSACIHHQTFTDSEQRVVGRRYGNMPVAGANIVEAQNFSRNNSRNSSVRGHRSFSNANESLRSSRRRQRPPLQLQGSRYDQETQGLLAQVQNKLALESGDTALEHPPFPEIIVPRASVSEFDLLEETPQNQSSRPQNVSPNFIPIRDTLSDPLSIEDDDELPPYEENPGTNEERLHYPESISRTNTDEDIQNLDNFDRHSDTLTFNSDLHSSATFHSEERSNTGNVRPVSYFEEPQNVIKRERSHTLGSVPVPQISLLNPARQDIFLGEQDPQGVSYCEFSRQSDKIITQKKPKHYDDTKYSAERALQRENSLKSARKSNGESEIKNEFCFSSPFFNNEIDPRRLSKASTVSLPAGFAPPKPPRIFTVEMSSLQSPLNESQEIVKPVEKKIEHPSIDLSQVVLRRKKPIIRSYTDDVTRSTPSSFKGSDEKNQGFNFDSMTPLSVKTSQTDDHYSSFSKTKPYAQSSPKLKALEKLTLPTISPCLSPIPRTAPLEEESSFSENVRREVRSSGDMNVKKPVEKKRTKLDVKRKDPHPLSLLPYLTKSVSEFPNDNSIAGLENQKKASFPNKHSDVENHQFRQTFNEDSDEELKKFLGIKCNSKSIHSDKEVSTENDHIQQIAYNERLKAKHSETHYQPPVSNPVSSQKSRVQNNSRIPSEMESGQTSGSSATGAPSPGCGNPRNNETADQPNQASGARNKPIYSILL